MNQDLITLHITDLTKMHDEFLSPYWKVRGSLCILVHVWNTLDCKVGMEIPCSEETRAHMGRVGMRRESIFPTQSLWEVG